MTRKRFLYLEAIVIKESCYDNAMWLDTDDTIDILAQLSILAAKDNSLEM